MMPAAITLAAMCLVYGMCMKGDLARLAAYYFVFSCINAALYYSLLSMPGFLVYGYGILEESIKIIIITHIYGSKKHRPLLVLLFLHILNHGWHHEHTYDEYNDVLIYLEMAYFIGRSGDVVARTYKDLLSGNFFNFGNNRRSI